MDHVLLVVEGAHDSAFFGQLLKARGYSQIEFLERVPLFWKHLVPEKYPASPDGRLDRVVVFPDFWCTEDASKTVAIAISGGDTRLIPTLRVPLEILEVAKIGAIGIAMDADWAVSATERFEALSVFVKVVVRCAATLHL